MAGHGGLVTSVLGRQRQDDYEFKASLIYKPNPVLKSKQTCHGGVHQSARGFLLSECSQE
jgi:hypothetical protein